nr:hypothetical protein [Mycobacterium sp. UM_NZ2]
MYEAGVYGTFAEWAGSLLTGLSVLAGVLYYIFDRRRERRAQAGSVVVWLHPHEHGPPLIKMQNLSDKPVFDHGSIVTAKPTREIQGLAANGWAQSGPFRWPENNWFECRDRHSFLDYHDGSELHLAPGQLAQHLPTLQYAPAVYNYYVYFRDVSGAYWVIDAKTQRPVGARGRRQLDIEPGGLHAV